MKRVAGGILLGALLDKFYPPGVKVPEKRSDCWDFKEGKPVGPRPCTFVFCRFNNFFSDATETATGTTYHLSHPGSTPEEWFPHMTCTKDIVAVNGLGEKLELERIGEIFGLTRERVRQTEEATLYKLRRPTRKIVNG